MIERFADDERGGFFETSSDHEQLVARRKDLEDHPIPSGNAAAALGLLRLAALTGEYAYEERAAGVLALLHPLAAKHPHAFSHLLLAADFHLAPVREVALAGDDTDELARVVRAELRPHLVLAGGEPDGVPAAGGTRAGRRPRRRPTCASASPASGRSRRHRSWRLCSPLSQRRRPPDLVADLQDQRRHQHAAHQEGVQQHAEGHDEPDLGQERQRQRRPAPRTCPPARCPRW